MFDESKQVLYTLSGGAYLRANDAIIPTFKLDYKQYTFSLSYDINSSDLNTVSRSQGGIEISIYKRGYIYRKPWLDDKNRCPRFEQMILPNYSQ
jgi:hypothetical protein